MIFFLRTEGYMAQVEADLDFVLGIFRSFSGFNNLRKESEVAANDFLKNFEEK